MSRKINFDAALSEEDKDFLRLNGRTMEIEVNEARFHPTDPDPSAGSVPTGNPGSVPGAQPARTGVQTAQRASAAAQPVTDGSEASEGEDEGDNYDDETAWPYKDLQADVAERREEQGEDYSGPALNSSREDLIAWLREDDQAAAEEDPSDD